MWFQRTELVAAEEVETLVGLSPRGSDFESLVKREGEIRAFALGEIDLDVPSYVNLIAVFVDVHCVVRRVDELLKWSDILGVHPADVVVEDVDFSGSGRVVVSTTCLALRDPSTGVAVVHVVWTKTWQLDDLGWRILSSHASRN